MKDEIDCPGCGDKIKLKPKKQTHEVEIDMGAQTQIMEKPKPEEPPRKITHEEQEEIIPTNYGKCPGEDCRHQKIKAKNQAKKFKICSNDKCESNSVRKDQPCPTCGKDFDEDAWKELENGVDLTEDEDGD